MSTEFVVCLFAPGSDMIRDRDDMAEGGAVEWWGYHFPHVVLGVPAFRPKPERPAFRVFTASAVIKNFRTVGVHKPDTVINERCVYLG